MSADDLVPCLYCRRRFQDLKAAHIHMIAKHRTSYTRPDDVVARDTQMTHAERSCRAAWREAEKRMKRGELLDEARMKWFGYGGIFLGRRPNA